MNYADPTIHTLSSIFERTSGQKWATCELRDIIKQLEPILNFGTSHDNWWIAGGCLRRALDGSPQDGDIDVYFRDKPAMHAFVRRCFDLYGHKSVVSVIVGGERIKLDYASTPDVFSPDINDRCNTIIETLNGVIDFNIEGIDVQAICFKEHESDKDVIENFDLTITQLVSNGSWLRTGCGTLDDITEKRLKISNVRWPISTFRRINKYQRYGYKISDEQIADFIKASPMLLDNKSIYAGHITT